MHGPNLQFFDYFNYGDDDDTYFRLAPTCTPNPSKPPMKPIERAFFSAQGLATADRSAGVPWFVVCEIRYSRGCYSHSARVLPN